MKHSQAQTDPRTSDRTARQEQPQAAAGFALQGSGAGSPGVLAPSDLLALQRTVGNRAVARMLGPWPWRAVGPAPGAVERTIQRYPIIFPGTNMLEDLVLEHTDLDRYRAAVQSNALTQPP